MKRIGILGGLSAESSTHFYSALTRLYVDRCGDTNYPEIVLFSVRFHTFMEWAHRGEWGKFTEGLLAGLRNLEAAGADFGVIAANLPHVVFDRVKEHTSLPLLHIADGVALEAKRHGFKRVALMGTLPTMAATFYPDRLRNFGIECMVPSEEQQHLIQHVLDTELFRGIVTKDAEQKYIHVIESMKKQGADAVILGCTEIPMLISDQNSPLPVLDSTLLFVQTTLDAAMEADTKVATE
ncbi:amino acid racemase [Alicyclobacillus tolerans]|uniref:aspartate/glutamate racemase family protein n=1 Tax=Alicyclobacillus tolerans TaxID=90970 RepID=UPI001F022184|nr:amino acid racemase [Alicyclobacillus tolerans]MCF8565143.1 amino acid racemase [Alicyclobacillus tolerans]